MRQGRSTLRRLNRYEYESTVRDLLSAPWLQLKDSLPEDGIVNRFNKSGQGLYVSHVQMARYLEAAEQALRDALSSAKTPSRRERQYAREQKPLIRRMTFAAINNHPERATIPILDFEAQPDVPALKAPMTLPGLRGSTSLREPWQMKPENCGPPKSLRNTISGQIPRLAQVPLLLRLRKSALASQHCQIGQLYRFQ